MYIIDHESGRFATAGETTEYEGESVGGGHLTFLVHTVHPTRTRTRGESVRYAHTHTHAQYFTLKISNGDTQHMVK